MHWIKNVIVDITITLFITIAFSIGVPWMWWVIAAYTLLMLIAKGMVLTSGGLLHQTKKSQQSPEWFIHLLYTLNVLLLGLAGWWYLFVGWIFIWLFSYLGQRKMITV